jgi:phosphotriesterase-related protein
MDIQPDSAYTRRVLDSGVSVAFDTIGKQYWEFFLTPKSTPQHEGELPARFYFRSDESRMELLLELIDEGFARRILLAQDLTGAEAYVNPTTHGTWGLNYLGGFFLPRLRERGVSEEDIDTLTRANPLELLGQR